MKFHIADGGDVLSCQNHALDIEDAIRSLVL